MTSRPEQQVGISKCLWNEQISELPTDSKKDSREKPHLLVRSLLNIMTYLDFRIISILHDRLLVYDTNLMGCKLHLKKG